MKKHYQTITTKRPYLVYSKKIALCTLALCYQTQAATLSLTTATTALAINGLNGAIHSLSYNSVEFTRVGTFVSDWGMQLGTNTGSFKINDTNGVEQIPVNVFAAGSTIVASGVYSSASTSILVNRIYSLASANLVEINSSFTVLADPSGGTTFRYFDTYDPDQGAPALSFSNSMDVYALGGYDVAGSTATNGYTMILAGENGFTKVASGGPFQIDSGSALNGFFTSPVDANGSFLDRGMHSAFEFTLDVGQSVQARHFIALGETKLIAEAAIVPESSSSLLSAGGMAFFLLRRKKS